MGLVEVRYALLVTEAQSLNSNKASDLLEENIPRIFISLCKRRIATLKMHLLTSRAPYT